MMKQQQENQRLRPFSGRLAAAALVIAFAWTGSVVADPMQDMSGLSQRVAELEAALSNVSDAGAELEARITELESLVRLLHRDSAAVVEESTSGTSGTAFNSINYIITVCSQVDYEANAGNCPIGSPDIAVQLTDFDDDTIFTFTADNEPDFGAIVAALTNGQVDRIVRRIEFGPAATASARSEESYFESFLTAEAVDLAAFDIESIKLSVDFVSIGSSSQSSSFSLATRTFFVIAE